MAVYQGADSCYALNEQIYVRRLRRSGVDTVREAAGILYLVLRDYRRGWTYRQGDCKKTRMTENLFEKRVRFVAALAKIHGAPRAAREAIERLVEHVLKKKRLPKTVQVGSRRLSVRKLVEEALARKR